MFYPFATASRRTPPVLH